MLPTRRSNPGLATVLAPVALIAVLAAPGAAQGMPNSSRASDRDLRDVWVFRPSVVWVDDDYSYGGLHGTRFARIQDGIRAVATGGTDAQLRLQEIPDAEPESESPTGPGADVHPLLMRGLELVRAEFEEKTWRAFWRSTVDGADTADIAAELGISPSTVRTAKSRVMCRLREELRDLLD